MGDLDVVHLLIQANARLAEAKKLAERMRNDYHVPAFFAWEENSIHSTVYGSFDDWRENE